MVFGTDGLREVLSRFSRVQIFDGLEEDLRCISFVEFVPGKDSGSRSFSYRFCAYNLPVPTEGKWDFLKSASLDHVPEAKI